MTSKKKRAFFEWQNPAHLFGDNEIDVISSANGVAIAVSEEQAMDSYNSTFTCEIVLPWPEVEKLRDFLSEALKEQAT
jgi:hypothetical protein